MKEEETVCIHDEQKNYFLPVPNEIIRYIKYFTGNEIKLLIYMLSVRNIWDRQYGLSREIAAHCGFSKNTVTKLTASLTEKGLLTFQHNAKGKNFRLCFLAKGTKHTEVLSQIEESLSKGKEIRFPGIRYLHSAKKEKVSDFRYSTKFEDLFSGGYCKRNIQTNEDRKLGEREFDPFKCSDFHKMTGNEIKLLLFIKYRTAIKGDGKARLNHKRLSEELAMSHKLVASAMKRLVGYFKFVRTENAGDRQLYCINYKEVEIPKISFDFPEFSQKGVRPYIEQEISTQQDMLRDSRFSFSDSEKKELSTSQKHNDSQPGKFSKAFEEVLGFAKNLQSPSNNAVTEENKKGQTVFQKQTSEYVKPKLSPAFEMEAERMEKEKQQKLNPSYVPEEKTEEPDELEYIFAKKPDSIEKVFRDLEKLKADRDGYIQQIKEKESINPVMADILKVFVSKSIDGKIKDAVNLIKNTSDQNLDSGQKRMLSEYEKMIQSDFSEAA